jgi:bla regulator protein BlaR1
MISHLLQSTLCAAAAWLLTLAMGKNRASVRYWVWLAASAKFLVPFSVLVSAGSRFSWRTSPAPLIQALAQSDVSLATTELSRSLVHSGLGLASASHLSSILFAIWLCGVLVGLICWIRMWRHMRVAHLAARPLDLALPIPVLCSPAPVEPGVFGILRPVLLMPDGICDQLTPAQLEAVVAHELCHVRRRDNLTGAVHMLVETLFWFHPLVWWIRARLIEERERACDEEVLMRSVDPEVYAEGILTVCKFYLTAPACASGVTGSNLKKRIEAIMAKQVARNLGLGSRMLLVASAAVALGGPAVIGVLSVQPGHSQTQAGLAPPAFEAASVKLHEGGISRGDRTQAIEPARLTWFNTNLGRLIEMAYGVKRYQVSGPDWIVNLGSTDRYDVMATTGKPVPADEMKRMLRPLLAERFHLTFHRETRELPVFALSVAKGGPRLQPGDDGAPSLIRDSDGGWFHKNWSMAMLADWLSGLPSVGRPVIDRTGLQGPYSFHENLLNFPRAGTEETKAEIAARIDTPDDSFLSTLQSELGFKVQTQKAQIEILVIDHAEKVPTEN